MDMRNVAVGVVMEVIATTMVQPVPEEETMSPTLVRDSTAVVADCPDDLGTSQLRGTTADYSGLFFLSEPCTGPMSGGIGARAGTAIAA